MYEISQFGALCLALGVSSLIAKLSIHRETAIHIDFSLTGIESHVQV